MYNKQILYLLLENVICTFSAQISRNGQTKGFFSLGMSVIVSVLACRRKLSYGLYVSSSRSFQILTLTTRSTTGTSARCRSCSLSWWSRWSRRASRSHKSGSTYSSGTSLQTHASWSTRRSHASRWSGWPR